MQCKLEHRIYVLVRWLFKSLKGHVFGSVRDFKVLENLVNGFRVMRVFVVHFGQLELNNMLDQLIHHLAFGLLVEQGDLLSLLLKILDYLIFRQVRLELLHVGDQEHLLEVLILVAIADVGKSAISVLNF